MIDFHSSFITMRDDQLCIKNTVSWSLEPFEGSYIEPASLKITGIDLDDPNRNAIDEREALLEFFKAVRDEMKFAGCHRAIMVAHNASFDQGFLNAACDRLKIKRNPFHPFTALDTATMGALAFGHTVLSRDEVCGLSSRRH